MGTDQDESVGINDWYKPHDLPLDGMVNILIFQLREYPCNITNDIFF